MEKKYIWIIGYEEGSYDDWQHTDLFVTEDEEYAKKFYEKANKIKLIAYKRYEKLSLKFNNERNKLKGDFYDKYKHVLLGNLYHSITRLIAEKSITLNQIELR